MKVKKQEQLSLRFTKVTCELVHGVIEPLVCFRVRDPHHFAIGSGITGQPSCFGHTHVHLFFAEIDLEAM